MVLFVADFFHPVGGLAYQLFLNRNMAHGRGRCGTVPMLLIRRDPNHVTRPNILDGATPALHPATTCRHNQGLTQRMSVPRSTCTGFKRDTGADRPCWTLCLKQRVDPDTAGEIL